MYNTFRAPIVALCLAFAFLFAGPAQSGQVDASDIIFKEVEKRLIEEYYASRRAPDSRYERHHDDEDGERHRDKHGKSGKSGKHGKHEKYGKKHHGKNKKNKHGKHGLPPGLSKRHGLPPGLAKRKRLPPGLAKRDLPHALNDVLPSPSRGTERVVIDNNVVLIQKATGIVLDILLDAVADAN